MRKKRDITKLEKIDMRKVGADAQYVIRRKTIDLLNQGYNGCQIAKMLGVSTTFVYKIRDLNKKNDLEGLKLKQRGRKKGAKRILTPDQEEKIQQIILNTYPEDHGSDDCLWTRKNTSAMILETYNVQLKLSTMGDYLRRWGYSAQRPIRRNIKQDNEKIQKWVSEEFPLIKAKAKDEGAIIFFGDETNIRNTTAYARGYAPKNNPPKIKVSCDKTPKINMISAVANDGTLRFMLYKGNMNSSICIDFLRRLIYDRYRNPMYKKVFLILDNLSVHISQDVKVWVERHKYMIEIFYLPTYAPEYNPDENINSSLKRAIGAKKIAKTEKELEYNVRLRMMGYRKNSDLVKGCFGMKTTQYAASPEYLEKITPKTNNDQGTS